MFSVGSEGKLAEFINSLSEKTMKVDESFKLREKWNFWFSRKLQKVAEWKIKTLKNL